MVGFGMWKCARLLFKNLFESAAKKFLNQGLFPGFMVVPTLAEIVENEGLKVSVELDKGQKKRLYETGKLPNIPEWLHVSSFAVPNFRRDDIPDLSFKELEEVAAFAPGNRRLAYQLAVARKLSESARQSQLIYSVLCTLPSLASAEALLEKLRGVPNPLTVLAVLGDLNKGEKPNYSVYDLIGKVNEKGFVATAAMSLEKSSGKISEADKVRRKVERGAKVFYTQPLFAENAENLNNILLETRDLDYEVSVGIMVPFSEAVSRGIAAETPGVLPSQESFFVKLREAERGRRPYLQGIEMAKEGLRAAHAFAGKDPKHRVTGIHLYAVTPRRYGEINVRVLELLSSLFERRPMPAAMPESA